MLDHRLHPPRSREKKRNPWRQHVHRATRPRSYAIDKVWETVTSRCLGNGRSDARCKQYGGVKSIICYLCFMQHAWSCYFQSRDQLVVRRGQIRRMGSVIKTLEAQVGQFLLGYKCPVSRDIVVKEQDTLGDHPAAFLLQNVLQFHKQR